MVNQSKKNDPRFWAIWRESGAVENMQTAYERKMKPLWAEERRVEKERLSQVEKYQSLLKSARMNILISRTVDIVYRSTGSHLHALVASSEFTEQPEGNLVYVEAGSQHGILSLLHIPKIPASSLPQRVDVDGNYDRDPATRLINVIYLPPEDVIRAAYFGTLDDLMQNPNIGRR